MSSASAGGEGEDVVIRVRNDSGIQPGLGQTFVDIGLFGPIVGKFQAIGVHGAGLIVGEDLILPGAVFVHQLEDGMGLPEAFVLILMKQTKHGLVVHLVSVDDRARQRRGLQSHE